MDTYEMVTPLGAELARNNCRVHQPTDPILMTREPSSTMQPLHWRWQDLAPLLERIGTEVALESGGQRRTLRLTNPGLPYGTTPTFWGSIQHILPGEVATAHRHAPSAFRFIMRGGGATTTVDGERYPMNQGDLVLTPSWAWHDHEHCGDEPMTWLDGLDISLVKSLHAMFFEPYSMDVQGVSSLPQSSHQTFGSGLMRPMTLDVAPKAAHHGNPLLVYSWRRAEDALREYSNAHPDPYDDFILEYQNPLNGGPALPTLGLALQWLRPGTRGKAHRHTGSVLYYVVRGEGRMIVDGTEFGWSEGDFVGLPPWAWHEHHNLSDIDEAILFQVNDLPTLTALGLYREEAHPDGHQ